ncbi:hypothetical protein VSP9026_00253 [Vibrio spartinae]|uniref:Uncharacterized protein n=1 Tax=Vibrio spartinae TaxID=1918945 RepID=A0A1N6LZN2_9VIBR|nr:hypothetical protein VSP9026_00253 [Vibrio spartinae]
MLKVNLFLQTKSAALSSYFIFALSIFPSVIKNQSSRANLD